MKKQWVVKALYETLTLPLKQSPFAANSSSRYICSSPPSIFALKNVTKSNFEPALADLRGLVRDADFVSIDLEMTGVTSAPWRESFEFDRFDIRYLKVKDSADKFAVVQFGVCPFRWDASNHSFVAHPHNFYLFPRQDIPVDSPSYEFLCQTASIDFLAKYQFDFNLCIREGISYLSRGQEDEALRRLDVVYNNESFDLGFNSGEARDTLVVRIADIFFTERLRNRIGEWRDGLLQNKNGEYRIQESINDSSQQFQTIFFNMRPAILLSGFTSHQLRLIQLVTEKHFQDLVYLCAKDEASSVQQLIVYIDSKTDRSLLMKEVKEGLRRQAEMKIKAAVGFRHVIDLLSSEQKLIVGHNCFLDIAHIHRKFLGPLPSTAEEYTSSIHKYFPYIIDTKILLNTSGVIRPMRKGSTSLSRAFTQLYPEIASSVKRSHLDLKPRVRVEVQVDDMRSSNWNSGAKHEAGYDAFMTGCVFIQTCSHLGLDFNLHSPFTNSANADKLQKHMNLLYLSWTNGDIIDLSTGNRTAESLYHSLHSHPKIIFSNIALIWGFLPKLKAREIKECISKVFGPNSVTSVYHLDVTAVFVQFSKAELVSDFLQLKETLERSNDPISVLHPLSKLLEGGNTCAATYKFYKKVCSSPVSEFMFADQAEAMGIKWKNELTGLNAQVGTPQENDMAASPSTANESQSGKLNNLINDLSRGHFRDDENIHSWYPAEAQASK
ncbi:poly(A)-specific ribonuclease PARN [Diospyros lotus]|uniref:poly(A)-specific ribonuclease PARN n=1 Tax=Diospyros lotus TaxID=55363 RepID=UPI00225B9615|nr:poly(A)-specific ribonuclease PARN [Diospyros lotus]